MALFHSQTQSHMINIFKLSSDDAIDLYQCVSILSQSDWPKLPLGHSEQNKFCKSYDVNVVCWLLFDTNYGKLLNYGIQFHRIDKLCICFKGACRSLNIICHGTDHGN